jgi:hypothetical protein
MSCRRVTDNDQPVAQHSRSRAALRPTRPDQCRSGSRLERNSSRITEACRDSGKGPVSVLIDTLGAVSQRRPFCRVAVRYTPATRGRHHTSPAVVLAHGPPDNSSQAHPCPGCACFLSGGGVPAGDRKKAGMTQPPCLQLAPRSAKPACCIGEMAIWSHLTEQF